MKEITILSGKGGAGKTSVTAAIASLVSNAVFCDNDVDAADLHLIFEPVIKERYTFRSGWIVTVNAEQCTSCGICADSCRFKAIDFNPPGKAEIKSFQCEGCRLCERVCPENAITSTINENNNWYISQSRFGTLVHADMGPGEENSGKLVSHVRKAAKETALKNNCAFVINDGPPGIGCAAISSLSGINLAVLVIEPTKSGLHDAQRLLELIRSFKIECCALINKANINTEMADTLRSFLKSENVPLIAEIPFDKTMVESMNQGKTIIEAAPESTVSQEIEKAWRYISQTAEV